MSEFQMFQKLDAILEAGLCAPRGLVSGREADKGKVWCSHYKRKVGETGTKQPKELLI
jgi:hypothetical protein